MVPVSNGENLRRVWRYYDRTESRAGYRLLLGGTKHFGWYEPGHSMWRFGEAMRRMEQVLGRTLGLPRGAAVLDAGCGMGDVARTLARQHGLSVTGVDILDFNVDEARRRSAVAELAGSTRFALGDYHELPFRDGCFDGVYTMETLVHAAHPERALAEFCRVLRPGGRLVMFEYSRTPDQRLSRSAQKALRRVCELAAMPAWQRLHHGYLEVHTRDAGFTVESVTDVTSSMLPMLRALAMLGTVPYLVARALGHPEKAVNALSGVELWRHRNAWRYNIYAASKPA